MSRRRLLIGFAVLVLATVPLTRWATPRSRITTERLKMVAVGMAQEEVFAVAGPPTPYYPDEVPYWVITSGYEYRESANSFLVVQYEGDRVTYAYVYGKSRRSPSIRERLESLRARLGL